jgi:hypothetical protein
MRRGGRGGEPIEGDPRHGGRATTTGGATLALIVAEHNNNSADAMQRRGFSWIGLLRSPFSAGIMRRKPPYLEGSPTNA